MPERPAQADAAQEAGPEAPTGAVTATDTSSTDTASQEGAATASSVPSPWTRGRELTALLYQERFGELWEALLPSAQARWGDLAAFEADRVTQARSFGGETSLLHEAVVEHDGLTSYLRTVTFEGEPGREWTVMFQLDDSGNVAQFDIMTEGSQAQQ